jgi:hypothetical protein
MHVHPNTVRYRLQQIATKTGHDPRTFTGLVELLRILEITDTDQKDPLFTLRGTPALTPPEARNARRSPGGSTGSARTC